MKVTIIHCSFIYTGGGERIVLEHISHLAALGYEVECYAPVIDEQACFPDIIQSYHIKTFLPQLPEWFPFRHAIILLLTCLLSPLFVFKFLKTDIFLGENQPGAWLAFVLAKILRKPYMVYLNQPNRVLYPRQVDVDFGWRATVRDYHLLFTGLQFVRPLLTFLDKISVVSCDALLTNGRYIGSVIEDVYGKRSIDAPAAADGHSDEISTDIFSGVLQLNEYTIPKPYALITNRHDPQKRFDYVIRAMVDVVKKLPDATLVIPGIFTEHTTYLQSLVAELGLEKNVLFLGAVSQSDLRLLYKYACTYCYPSPEEDYGLGPLEAGGWGVPTVAWNHGGPTVTVQDGITGFLCSPYSVEEYASRMISLFSSSLRLEMGRAALERVQSRFSWDFHSSLVHNAIMSVVSERLRYNPGYFGKRLGLQQLHFDFVRVGETGDVETEVLSHLNE